MSKHLNTPVLDYIRKLYAPQDALLISITQSLQAMDRAIYVGPEEGKLLQLLVHMHRVKTIVEIGTLGGYSALWMARALPSDGHLYTLEHDPQCIALARGFIAQSDVADRISLIEGKAQQTLAQIESKGPFDMIFIDADKISYLQYLDWAEKHVRKGGLIVADNTLLFDSVAAEVPPEGIAPSTWENMRIFNERLADSTRYLSVMIPTKEGLSIALKLT